MSKPATDLSEILLNHDTEQLNSLTAAWNAVRDEMELCRVPKLFGGKRRWAKIMGMPELTDNACSQFFILKLYAYIADRKDVPPDFCCRLRLMYEAKINQGLLSRSSVASLLVLLEKRSAVRRPEFPEGTGTVKKLILRIKWHFSENLYFDRNIVTLWYDLYAFFRLWVLIFLLGRADMSPVFCIGLVLCLLSLAGFLITGGTNIILAVRQFSTGRQPYSAGTKNRDAFTAAAAFAGVFIVLTLALLRS